MAYPIHTHEENGKSCIPLLWQFTWWTAETCEHWTVQHDLYLNCYLAWSYLALCCFYCKRHIILPSWSVFSWSYVADEAPSGPFTLSTYCMPGLPRLLFPGMVPVTSCSMLFHWVSEECKFPFTIRPCSSCFFTLSSFRMPFFALLFVQLILSICL